MRVKTYNRLFDVNGVGFGILVGDDIARGLGSNWRALRNRRLEGNDGELSA